VAAWLAAGQDVDLTLLRVVSPPPTPKQSSGGEPLLLVDLEERRADEVLAANAAEFPSLRIDRAVLVSQHPAEAIIAYLHSNPTDMIVMATHGRSGLRRLAVGSVTEAVLRSGLAPVVAVRPATVQKDAMSYPHSMPERMSRALKILVTLDGSHLSEAILDVVAKIARPLDAEVELFTVGRLDEAQTTPVRSAYVEMMPSATYTGTPIGVPLPSEILPPVVENRVQAMSRLEASLHDYLDSHFHALEGVRVETHVKFADDAAATIVERARQTKPDLIAMATHGRTGLNHLLAGSVCEQVIRSGVAPVIVLRP
jgi:nucleotide-binding universal stress UspA family protein